MPPEHRRGRLALLRELLPEVWHAYGAGGMPRCGQELLRPEARGWESLRAMCMRCPTETRLVDGREVTFAQDFDTCQERLRSFEEQPGGPRLHPTGQHRRWDDHAGWTAQHGAMRSASQTGLGAVFGAGPWRGSGECLRVPAQQGEDHGRGIGAWSNMV